mmetsp:Transcript_38810/g.123400  ORF Transcript_38810/g.123400 Transcript_38810/m.123400 type:complete len:223 (+) Transcript_38810:381-1049(+)
MRLAAAAARHHALYDGLSARPPCPGSVPVVGKMHSKWLPLRPGGQLDLYWCMKDRIQNMLELLCTRCQDWQWAEQRGASLPHPGRAHGSCAESSTQLLLLLLAPLQRQGAQPWWPSFRKRAAMSARHAPQAKGKHSQTQACTPRTPASGTGKPCRPFASTASVAAAQSAAPRPSSKGASAPSRAKTATPPGSRSRPALPKARCSLPSCSTTRATSSGFSAFT